MVDLAKAEATAAKLHALPQWLQDEAGDMSAKVTSLADRSGLSDDEVLVIVSDLVLAL